MVLRLFSALALMMVLVACSGDAGGTVSANSDAETNAAALNNSADPSAGENADGTTLAADTSTSTTDADLDTPADDDTAGLVARVNGEGISEDEFTIALRRRMVDTSVTDQAALAEQVLEALIEQRLIEQSAPDMGVIVTEEEVTAEIDLLKNAVSDETSWQQFLLMNGYTEEEMRAAQRESLITQRVRDRLVENLRGNVRQVNARHILVRTEAEASTVLRRLEAGENFAAVAAEVSIDVTTRDQGGSLGWFTQDELMDRQLADTAFSLAPGNIAGPIATRIGYHVLQTLEVSERPIEPERLPMLMENVFTNWLEEQREQAVIERFI